MGETYLVSDGPIDAALPGWAAQGYDAWMRLALAEAAATVRSGEEGLAVGGVRGARGSTEAADVPVGAVVVDAEGVVIGRGRNVREADADPTGHAEIVALRAAGADRHTWRLGGCTLVVTLEPCAMCAGAAVLSRVDQVVFGAFDRKAGACGSVWDLTRDRSALHRPHVVAGVLERECQAHLVEFFHARRLG